MARRVLLGVTLFSAVLCVPGSAWGQAAAESALANSNSAGAASKVGSALSKGLTQATEKLGNQVSNAVQNPQQSSASRVTRKPYAPAAEPTPENPLPQDRAWPRGKVPLLMPLGDAGLDCTNKHRAENNDGSDVSNNGYTICAPSATAKTKPNNGYEKVVEVKF